MVSKNARGDQERKWAAALLPRTNKTMMIQLLEYKDDKQSQQSNRNNDNDNQDDESKGHF